MSELGEWDSFYVIVGSAAGALIGLQFVVMTLIAERPPLRAAEAGPVFATPTIVHFSAVLLVSAVLRMPWQALMTPAAILGFIGFGGAAYLAITAFRLRKQSVYHPDLEDWLFHVVLPFLAYLALPVSAFAAPSYAREALFGIGASILLLLFIGIHNAWDSVAYMVFVQPTKPNAERERDKVSDAEK